MASTASTAANLWWEASGAGPALLLVPGTPGYGGQFAELARALANDHLVVVYDRRGTARSAAIAGSSTTSVQEQADDAAAILEAVGLTSATVFGTSNGAMVAVELALRHPHRVRRAILHEMPLVAVLRDPAAVSTIIGSIVEPAMAAGGPRAALDAFLRFAYGDGVVEGWSSELRERMLADAAMVLMVELPAFQAYRPDPDGLAASRVPFDVLVGEDQHVPFFREAAEWLVRTVGGEVRPAPGAHGPQFTDPIALAGAVRELERMAR